MNRQGDVLVGLDVGTSKICAVVAEVNDEDSLEIVGLGKNPSKGLNRGAVVNIDQTVESIRAAVEEAEFISGTPIRSAFVGVAGGHVRSFNTNGIVAIKNKIVTREDINRVVEQARAVTMPADHQIIHVLPQEYIVDEQEGVTEPSGMAGVRLECKVHVVTGAIPAIQNITQSVERAGLEIESLVLQPLASSLAALGDDERDLGVVLVDIGSGTVDLAVLSGGALRYSAIIPVGGQHVTRDIAIGLRTPDYQAEKIKQKHGCALASRLSQDREIEVPSVGGPAAARAESADARRDHRAAHGGDSDARPPRDSEERHGGHPARRRRAHGRCEHHRGRRGAGRGRAPAPGANRRPRRCRGAGGHGQRAHVLHRRRPRHVRP